MKQSEIFLKSEGDAMFARMEGKQERDPDPVLAAIEHLDLNPRHVIEFGCGSGWRLHALSELYGSTYRGIDPSPKAISAARAGEKEYYRWAMGATDCWAIGTTVSRKVKLLEKQQFDMVIYGFCLYLVDMEDLFETVYLGDKILKNGGHLVIFDFYPNAGHYDVNYKHKEGIKSHHMNFANFWLAHPHYQLLLANYGYYHDTGSAVTVLRKNAYGLETKDIGK